MDIIGIFLIAVLILAFIAVVLEGRPGRRHCPFCAKHIDRGVTICPHCQSDIPTH